MTEAISREPRITVRREEVTAVDEADGITIIATGPLTSDGLAAEIARLSASLAEAASDKSTRATGVRICIFMIRSARLWRRIRLICARVYMAARYDKGSADYINCPMTPEEYGSFYDALVAAQSVEEKDWEKLNYFESCLPIEEIARRGRDTLRFGPMKPVGLIDPRNGQDAVCGGAVAAGKSAGGFLQPGGISESFEVWRAGAGAAADSGAGECAVSALRADSSQYLHQFADSVARDFADEGASAGFVCRTDLRSRRICGVDCDRVAGGDACGGSGFGGLRLHRAPRASAFGSLTHYVTQADAKNFQPANITFDLLPPLEKKIRDRKERHRLQCELALREFGDGWWRWQAVRGEAVMADLCKVIAQDAQNEHAESVNGR